MFKPVNIHTDTKLGTIKISSRPEAYVIVLFLAALMGICALPFTGYRNDFIAYISLFFVLGLTVFYGVISRQSVIFENQTHISVRKGLAIWIIPLDAVTGGYTTYNERVSRQSLARSHYLNVELQVNLPDHQRHRIRNGKANIFHYGFSQWGLSQEKIRQEIHAILTEKGIPILTLK